MPDGRVGSMNVLDDPLKNQTVILLISCLLVSCAAGDERLAEEASTVRSGGSDCIFRPSIRGYTVLNESNLIVETSGRRSYHVSLQRRAFGLTSSWGIGFASRTSRICSGFSEMVFAGHMDTESIRIASIRKLNREEHEDLLIQFGKKEPEIKQAPAQTEVKGAEVEELDPAAREMLGN